jgi:hypothetical protein
MDVIGDFLSVRRADTAQRTTATLPVSPTLESDAGAAGIDATVEAFVSALTEADMQGVSAYWKDARGVPSDLDRKLLAKCRDAIGRNLERDEIKKMRACFQRIATARLERSASFPSAM